MASLTFIEKQLLEELFGMSSGYVLDFSDRTYESFFRDFGIDIEQVKYHKNGRSKAKRLRVVWELEDNRIVGEVIQGLLDYTDSFNPNSSAVTQRHRDIVDRLLEREPKKQEQTEAQFLDIDFGELDTSGLHLEIGISETIEQRVNEIKLCLQCGASLAAIFLCGSTLEGILLNFSIQNPRQFNTAISAPKNNEKVKQFQYWSLNDLINVTYELNLISEDVKKFSHALRDFRNYIHPFEQASTGFRPDVHTANISWQVLQAAIADLSGSR